MKKFEMEHFGIIVDQPLGKHHSTGQKKT